MLLNKHGKKFLALSIAAACYHATTLQAQDAAETNPTAATAPANSAPNGGKPVNTLQQIQVTAQKREQAIQDVPIALTVLSSQQLHDSGVHDIKDLQNSVAALNVSSTLSSMQTTARIRGVGTVGDNPGLESSVGVLIDGVPRARNGVAMTDLGNVDSIEVLKGPQGTLFGKNTSAGLIDIHTQAPSFSPSGYAQVDAGNYGAFAASAYYTNAISNDVAFSVYVGSRKHDGYNDVSTGAGPRTQTDDANQDMQTIRTQLLWKASQDVNVRFIADYTHDKDNCCTAAPLVLGPTAPIIAALTGGSGLPSTADPSNRDTYANRATTQSVTDQGVSAEVSWMTPWFNNAQFTSITSLRKWNNPTSADLDYTAADILYRPYDPSANHISFRTLTQEFRLASSTDHVDWTVGAYLDDEHLQRTNTAGLGSAYEPYLSIAALGRIAGAFPAGMINTRNGAAFLAQAAGMPVGTLFPAASMADRWNQTAKSAAPFADITWHLTDKLDLSAGARYTFASKALDSYYSNPSGAPACSAALAQPGNVAAALIARGVPAKTAASVVPTVIGFMCLPWSNPAFNGLSSHQNLDENEASGSLKLAYRFDSDVMGYVSAARGYKAGGFNLDREQSANGQANGAAGIKPVANTAFPGEFVDSYEMGAKTTWLGGNLLVDTALFQSNYTDFQLNSFIGTSYVVRSIPHLRTHGLDTDVMWQTPLAGLSMQGGFTYLRAHYGNDPLPDPSLALLPGSTSSFAPEWQVAASLAYQWSVTSNLYGRLHVGAKYSSSYNTGSDLAPQKIQPAYTLVDARFTLGTINKRWAVELYGQNLTNRSYMQVAFDAPIQAGSYDAFMGAPRTYGVDVRVGF